MDDRLDERIKEYGAINITGFRIVDTERPVVQQFFRNWETLDPAIYPGAGKSFVSVYIEHTFLSIVCTTKLIFSSGSCSTGLRRCDSVSWDFQPDVEEETRYVQDFYSRRR